MACYSAADPSADVVVWVMAEFGVAPWPVPPAPDAAEAALLRHARNVHQRGGRVFVVASGDHRFAELATLGRPEVLAWERHPVGRRLREAAHSLRWLPWPDPAASEPLAGEPEPDGPVPAAAAVTPAASVSSDGPPVRADLVGSLLAGVCIGLGIAV